MKKAGPYIVGGVILLLLVMLMVSTKGTNRRFDETVTLRESDRIPYGTRVARELLPSFFPEARFPFDRKYPGIWDSIETYRSNQAVILIADYFEADREELESLSDFVGRGNYVFLIARNASDDLSSFFRFGLHSEFSSYYGLQEDSLQVKLEQPAFQTTGLYTYPGRKYESYFTSLDSVHTTVLGTNDKGFANFIRMDKGSGSFFVHTAPLAFSNYFILHKNNSAYYEAAISVLPKHVNTVLWNEYFLEKPRQNNSNRNPNWLATLFSYPSFKWGLLIAAFTLVLFVLLGMRRRQRIIPPYERPKNDSLDFVKTLGRLYYDRKDHKNLAGKMAAYFLEHVRSTFKLPTHTLDDTFVMSLHFKSGYPEKETRDIIDNIHHINTSYAITDKELSHFHKQLELFYQNT
ncbi:MAG TPA: DUF4350 domain-containing protein [Flavisolibacter sp.]